MDTLHKVLTTITVMGEDPVFTALTRGDTWNGWVTPGFPRPEAERVVKWINDCTASLGFVEDQNEARWYGDKIALLNHAYEDTPKTWADVTAAAVEDAGKTVPLPDWLEVITADEFGLYWIGAYAWTWEDHTPANG